MTMNADATHDHTALHQAAALHNADRRDEAAEIYERVLKDDLTPEYLGLQARMNQATGAYDDPNAVAAIGIGGTPKPTVGPDGQPLDGNESPDDILTIQNTETGETVRVTRTQYEAELRNYPQNRGKIKVLNAEPAPPPTPVPGAGAAPAPAAPPAAPSVSAAPAAPGNPLLGPPPAVPGSATPVAPAVDPKSVGAPEPTGWSAPQEEMAMEMPGMGGPSSGPVAAVGALDGPMSMEARARQMISEGYSPEEVDEAMRRVLGRYGAVA